MRSIRDYYEALAPTYDHDRFGNSYGQYVDTMERALLKAWLRNRAPESVLDLGCGTGRLLGFACTGVDSSPAMLAEAGKKWPQRRLVHAEAANTGLAADGFDGAICFHVFMHLDRPACEAIFHEAARIVKRGGSVIFDIPSKPRRELSGRPGGGWHGSNAACLKDVRIWAGSAWRLKRWRGILFFPIHRVPSRWRAWFSAIDALIGRTLLARWSSYYLCELERV